MQSIKISVITPTSNSAATVEKCVKSVASQNFSLYEHIIVDNVSRDATLEIIKKVYQEAGRSDKLKIFSEKDAGISDAFNKGIKHAGGEIIVILNSDDYFLHENVFELSSAVFLDEKILFVHGNVFFNDEVYGSNVRRPLLCNVQTAMPYNHPGMFFRKSVYDEFGSFNTAFKYAMDFEFICKLTARIKNFASRGFYFTNEPMVFVSGGGASWVNEVHALHEVKSALQTYHLWNAEAKKAYAFRIVRVKLKNIFSTVGLTSLVKTWRNHKWQK